MRILYLNPSGQLGGAESSLLNLLSGLRYQDKEFRPFVVATEEGPFTTRCAQMDVPYEVLPLPRRIERLGDSSPAGQGLSRVVTMARLLQSTGDFAGYAKAIAVVLQREKPDLIHTNGFKMHIAGAWVNGRKTAKMHAPLVAHIHDYVSTRPLAGQLLRAGSRRFAHFIANSQSVALDVQNFFRARRVSTVYNAIDLKRFCPEGNVTDLDALCGLDPAAADVVRVGLVATFAKWKGHLTFFRALSQLKSSKPVRAYVIGGPIYRTGSSQFALNELQAEVSRLGLTGKVGFTGFLDDIPGVIRALDVVVHASTKPEPFGMTIIEAMACGRPVVVSGVGGAKELFVEGVSGLGHLPGDERELACAIDRLIQDPALRRQLAIKGRHHASLHFPISEMARRVWDIYGETISESRTRRLELM